jgi:streptogramin lyase
MNDNSGHHIIAPDAADAAPAAADAAADATGASTPERVVGEAEGSDPRALTPERVVGKTEGSAPLPIAPRTNRRRKNMRGMTNGLESQRAMEEKDREM